MEDGAQLRIVLNRLMEENRYSLDEYDRRIDGARKSGNGGAAERMEEAKQSIERGNEALRAALKLIK